VLRPLPAKLKTRLGQPLTVNHLQVKPLGVMMHKVLIKRGNFTPDPMSTPSLVLFLELTNVSQDQEFCPLDPWYDRHYKENAQGLNLPFTFLEMGTKRFLGGPAINEGDVREVVMIDDLDEDLEPAKGKRFGQKADHKLLPGEKMVTFVATDPEHDVGSALKGYSGPLVYRVRLRNGLSTIRGRELSTTAVVGVEFDKQDIKDLTRGS
jgi:hypothetical protein